MSRAKNIAKKRKREQRQEKAFNANIIKGKAAYKKRRGTGLGWIGELTKKPTAKGHAKGAFGKRRQDIDERPALGPQAMKERKQVA